MARAELVEGLRERMTERKNESTFALSGNARGLNHPIDEVLTRLEKVAKSGNGYSALCPAHDDHNPSLSISEGADGRVLLFCHTGCYFDRIVEAMGLDVGDLFLKDDRPNGREPQAVYEYFDENGALLFEVVRLPDKQFRQRRPDGQGGLIWDRQGVKPVLYRLPELREAPPFDEVYIVEGEKDVDLLVSKELTATTNPGGAGKWQEEYSELLRDRKVVILPDNDDVGRRHADDIARSLTGKAESIKILQLPGLPPKGDVSDWFAAGGNVEELGKLAYEAEDISTSVARRELDDLYRELGLLTLSELRDSLAEVPRWLVERLLTRDGVSLIVSRPGVGKSTLARFLARCVSRGELFLGRETDRGEVFYFAIEESAFDVTHHFARMGDPEGKGIRVHVGSVDAGSLPKIQRLVTAARPALIIVDTLEKGLGVQDINDYSQISRSMQAWIALARDCQAHVMFVHHQSKGDLKDGRSVLGSTAIEGAVDTILILSVKEKTRFLQVSKQRSAVADQLDATELQHDPETGIFAMGREDRELKNEAIDDKVVEALDEAGRPLTSPDIEEMVGRSKAATSASLKRLRESGRVEWSGDGKKGSPYEYWVAAGEDSSTTQEVSFSPSGSSTQGERGESWTAESHTPVDNEI